MKADDIFQIALEKATPAERTAYLDAVCAHDPELRARVEELLQSHEQAGSFLQQPLFGNLAAVSQSSTESPATVIGAYKLIEQIGEGGMGTVWMAQQSEPVRRTVALKLIKAGMDTRQVITRFEAERQALALMDHPNIAKVLDAGTTESGRPYFVMELVNGVPITTYCDEQHLTPKKRLELFVPVCQAIQHAHQKGIIHRDLKPSNVLVSLYDGRPVPKVIDFGVAKAVGQPLTEKTLVTGLGNLVGTLEYMSPEQAEVNQLDIDTRSDIYSLGVLLYELLTGSTPFSRDTLQQAGMLEMLRVIREQEPSRPSTKLSTAEGLPTLAANRGTEPAKLTKLVRGELDWIVMKALEKDRTRRYETANSFAQDIEHYLNDETVQACSPSLGYRLQKFIRKHRLGLTAATSILLLALTGTAASTWQAVRAARAEAQALADRDEKERARKAESLQRELAEARHKEALSRLYVARMASMNQAAESGNFTRLRRLLKESTPRAAEPDYRGWEWYLLQKLSTRNMTEIVGSDAYAGIATWSQSSGQIALGTQGGAIDILDRDGKHVRTLRPGRGRIGGLKWSPDGKRLACIADGKLGIWEASGSLLHLLTAEHSNEVMAWAPDGTRLAFPGADGQPRLWDVEQGKELQILETHREGDYASDFAWHPDGERLATGHRWGRTIVWDINSGETLFNGQGGGAPVRALAWNPDGTILASCSGRDIQVWNSQGEGLSTLVGHTSTIQELSWSPDGRQLLSGADDRTARVWDVAGGQTIARIACDERLRSVGWRPDGKELLLGLANSNGVFLVRGFDSRESADVVKESAAGLAAWSPNGKWIATADTRGTVEIVGAEDGLTQRDLSVHRPVHWASFVCWAPDSRCIAVTTWSLGCTVWDWETGKQVAHVKPPLQLVDQRPAWSPDGKSLALNGHRTIDIWDTASWTSVASFGTSSTSQAIAWSPDSRLVAAADVASVCVWNIHDRKLLYRTDLGNWIQGLAFSPDGAWLAASSNVDLIFLSAATGERARSARGEHSVIGALKWSPDGQRVAGACQDGCLRIWDAATLSEVLTLHCSSQVLQSVDWNSDGSSLACTAGGVLRIWHGTLPEGFRPSPLVFQSEPSALIPP